MDKAQSRARGDVVRAGYQAIRNGDLPGLLSCISPDVIMDRPSAFPWGGERRGRDESVNSVLSNILSSVSIDVAESQVFEGDTDVVGTWSGTLTVRDTGETMDVKVVEIFSVEDDIIKKIDVYYKNPDLVADFYRKNNIL